MEGARGQTPQHLVVMKRGGLAIEIGSAETFKSFECEGGCKPSKAGGEKVSSQELGLPFMATGDAAALTELNMASVDPRRIHNGHLLDISHRLWDVPTRCSVYARKILEATSPPRPSKDIVFLYDYIRFCGGLRISGILVPFVVFPIILFHLWVTNRMIRLGTWLCGNIPNGRALSATVAQMNDKSGVN